MTVGIENVQEFDFVDPHTMGHVIGMTATCRGRRLKALVRVDDHAVRSVSYMDVRAMVMTLLHDELEYQARRVVEDPTEEQRYGDWLQSHGSSLMDWSLLDCLDAAECGAASNWLREGF